MLIRSALWITAFGLLCNSLAVAQELVVDVVAVRTLVSKWNDAHTLSNIESLSALYSDTVSFYGSTVLRKKCISTKRTLLEKEHDLKQTLKNELILTGYSSGAIRCDFVKTVSNNSKDVDYASYLVIKQFDGRYLIVGESDLVTDRNVGIEPDFGAKIRIKNVADVPASDAGEEIKDGAQSESNDLTAVIVGVSFAAGVIGLLIAWGVMRRPTASKSAEHMTKTVQTSEDLEKGLALLQMTQKLFASRGSEHIAKRSEKITKGPEHISKGHQTPEKVEKELRTTPKPTTSKGAHFQALELSEKGSAFEAYVVHQFALNKSFFTLLDWRSDKFYRGVYPKSSQNPDLVYQFKAGDFVRKFSVECKYRSSPSNGLIRLMDERKYIIYEAFHRNEMRVYIALGIGGKPDSPAELYLIPFEDVKLEMQHRELSKYKSPGMFYYNRDNDRLT